jgi:tetratricopeptide (TPR) repeat protein
LTNNRCIDIYFKEYRVKNSIKSLACVGAIFVLTAAAGCSYLAVQTAPAKRGLAQRTDSSVQADKLFWQTLHGGEYGKIDVTLNALKLAYLENPSDDVTAAHIGWMHIWRLGERFRLKDVPAAITDDAVLARRYFQEAVNLNPNEARYLGFLASATLAEASIHKDEKLTRRAYFQLLESIDAWPEFNLFTAGYVLSHQPKDSSLFKEALEWQWQNLDICVGEKVSRSDPAYGKYMKLMTTEGKKRVCWNSWIAPHNFEGFFLNMGDMLVKSGDWQSAKKIYANAKLSDQFANWALRDVLERRIQDAQSNVAIFNAPQSGTNVRNHKMMSDSAFSCVACHQK